MFLANILFWLRSTVRSYQMFLANILFLLRSTTRTYQMFLANILFWLRPTIRSYRLFLANILLLLRSATRSCQMFLAAGLTAVLGQVRAKRPWITRCSSCRVEVLGQVQPELHSLQDSCPRLQWWLLTLLRAYGLRQAPPAVLG